MYEALRGEGRWVLPKVLAFQARMRPDDTFLIWSATGETLSYAKAASASPGARARPLMRSRLDALPPRQHPGARGIEGEEIATSSAGLIFAPADRHAL